MAAYEKPGPSSGRNQNGDSTCRARRSQQYVTSPTVLALTVLAGLSWWLFPPTSGVINPNQAEEARKLQFSWSQITPSQELEYQECFDGFQCARLDVPMDYHRTDGHGTRMAIAITRLPAKVPVTDPRYGGAVLINPGGPGGSGVAQALISGHNLQTIVDATTTPSAGVTGESQDRYFDIIGFDPRGVNNTTPGFSCFPNLFSQRNWELQAEADGMLGSSGSSFMRNWQRTIALNVGCSQTITKPSLGGDALGEHINTPTVARDMLEIVEKHAEWREKQGLAAQRQYDRAHGYDKQQSIFARTKWEQGQEKLLYWGRSYGTVLGATFATLYPDRIERMVLDGVVDAEKYYTGAGPEPLVDSDAIFDKFTRYCNEVGEDCPLYAAGGPAAIKEAYKTLENGLLNSSLPVFPSITRGPEVATWTDLKTVLRLAVYQPLIGFYFFAEIARDLLTGDGSKLADFKHSMRAPVCPSEECLSSGPWSSACEVPGQNELYASSAILCSDAEYMQLADEQVFQQRWRSLRELSSVIGDYWAHIHLSCVGWHVKPKWKMTYPLGGNTSRPLLFVNNLLDPVTPLQSAKKMSGAFPGSALLQQDSEGHCTLAAPSICVSMGVRKYFQTGELPDPGTICEADVKPLLGAPNKMEEQTPEGMILSKALLEEAERIRPLRLPF
ncbi:TAP-like protein-domain-containing protein [Aspergillus egyptiacus]|nr:TAP-like protein-domain-containing protein [Aspergillus egyptiacus]